MKETRTAKFNLLVSMFIFGTLSIVVRGISMPSSVIALARSFIGGVFLVTLTLCRGERPDIPAIKKNLRFLVPSGIMMGINWIMLFEAYRYSSVATATLCYYMEPTFLVLISPVVFKEKMTGKKLLCAFVALLGMVMVSGVAEGGLAAGELRGVLLALGAAVLYTAVVVCNRYTRDISPLDRTYTQLFSAVPALLVYILLTGQFHSLAFTGRSSLLLLIAGVVYTGFTFTLFFGALPRVSTQTAALLSYMDPTVAVLVSALFFRERLTLLMGVGAVLILGAAIASEWKKNKRFSPIT